MKRYLPALSLNALSLSALSLSTCSFNAFSFNARSFEAFSKRSSCAFSKILLFAFLLLNVVSASAQRKLTASRTSGYYTYVYKLTDKEAVALATNGYFSLPETMLHTLVDSLPANGLKTRIKSLPFGTYAYVHANANNLEYYLGPVQNAQLTFINNTKDFQFSLTDNKGMNISTADVTIGKRRKAKYDPVAHVYVARADKKNRVIQVAYNSVVNVFGFDLEADRPSSVPFFKRLFKKTPKYQNYRYYDGPNPDKYKGYLVFNKPMYKPKDTIKFKAYLVDGEGKALHNRVLRADLLDRNNTFKGTITTLTPYRDGGYEAAFVIADSLNVSLDEDYSVALKEREGDKWVDVYRGMFRYEDYELKALSFVVRADKEVQTPGNPVKLFMRATDENGLTVPDGRVEISILSRNVKAVHAERVFVKKVLYTKDMNLDPVGETVFLIPDSIFPKADMDFDVEFKFLNSNNESLQENKRLSFKQWDGKIESKLSGDSLILDYLLNGKSTKITATVEFEDGDGEVRDSLKMTLPDGMKIPARYATLNIDLPDDYDEVKFSELNAELTAELKQGKDSLRMFVSNPHQLPFWYTLFSGNKVMMKGYGTKLDTLIKSSNVAMAQLEISYLWGGEIKNMTSTSVYRGENLQVSLLAPVVVYPGQQVNMQVKVTNAEDLPVAGTDVTALAYTSKFKDGNRLNLPFFGKYYELKKDVPKPTLEDFKSNGQHILNWEKWAKSMHLDTIAYYQFTHPVELFENVEPVADELSQVMPFLIENGAIEPVNVVYIDDQPVYFIQASQLQNYVFRVSPGKHTIRLRSANFSAVLRDYLFVQHRKHVISIAADPVNTRATVKAELPTLSIEESDRLQRYMIRIADNFNGKKTLLHTEDNVVLVNPPPQVIRRGQLLVGPFKDNFLNFSSGALDQTFLKEPGYTYTFLPGLLKQKADANPYIFKRELAREYNNNSSYDQKYLDSKAIDSIWNEHLDLRSRTTSLFPHKYTYNTTSNGSLNMEVDNAIYKTANFIKNILIYKNGEPDFVEIYPGNTRYFNPLETGIYKMLYLFKDNQYFVAEDVEIKTGGENFFKWKIPLKAADQLSKGLDEKIKSTGYKTDTRDETERVSTNLAESFNAHYAPDNFTLRMTGRVIDLDDRKPVPGVRVKVKGTRSFSTTNLLGYFSIAVPKKGFLVTSSIGYVSKEVKIKAGSSVDIDLEQDKASLDEVVVVGYGVQLKQVLTTGSISTVNALIGRAAGLSIGAPGSDVSIQIRGLSSIPVGKQPLYIVDGVVVPGGITGLAADEIGTIQMMKVSDATGIYGAMAANGVVIVTTKKGNTGISADGSLVAQGGSMRTKFSDYAIWQPKLLTDASGKASFKVTFPDDITSWTTKVIAMNGNKQSGQSETTIKSFKTISANFVSPQFALQGDSIQVMGKLMNYGGFPLKAERKFSYNDSQLLNSVVNFKNVHLDTMAIVATGADSLKFEYTLKQDNGYFDGEIRKIPVFATGVLETKGYFNALLKDTTINYNFDAALGKVSLHAEASVFPVLLDEITKLRNYEYLCNEQMASKLKALLLEKKVRKYLDEDFKHEKDIALLLKKLVLSKRPEGTWGWWQDSPSSYWISLHVMGALLDAKAAGYVVNVDTKKLVTYLNDQLQIVRVTDRADILKLLMKISPDYSAKGWLKGIEDDLQGKRGNLYQELELMLLKQQSGVKVDIQGLLQRKKETMFGNVYWGELNASFWDNSIQNSLLAYRILTADGGHEQVLDQIMRYFLEQRKSGQWRNTYESSLILETILPKLIQSNKTYQPASLLVNGELVSQFPFQKTLASDQALKVVKKGDAPVYFTAYQQFVNPKPEKLSKDFTVTTSFDQNGVTVKKLKAGQIARLNVEVTARADGDYVMIEVPIPAGCSYESKIQSYWGVESHREYFKEKTSIFCTQLKQGKHTFTIELMPRYSGVYNLNPAKAELMYFPVFFGREGMKKVGVGN